MRPFRVPLMLLLVVASCLAALSALAREGGSDIGHSGGGGTFLRCESHKNQVFYTFWDLSSHCPSKDYAPENNGDKIHLSREGERAQGQWVDVRKLKSYRYLLKKVKLWEGWAPHFSRLLQKSMKEDLFFLATPLSIQMLAEIQVASGFGTETAVPGAYFGYGTQVLYVDTKVWNNSSLQSQVAMLLHEYLRGVQVRFKLKNAAIQKIVRAVMLIQPKSYTMTELLNPNFVVCGGVEDDLFRPERDQGSSVASSSPRKTAEAAVQEALAKGLLGGEFQLVRPSTTGHFAQPVSPPNPVAELDLLSCYDYSYDQLY